MSSILKWFNHLLDQLVSKIVGHDESLSPAPQQVQQTATAGLSPSPLPLKSPTQSPTPKSTAPLGSPVRPIPPISPLEQSGNQQVAGMKVRQKGEKADQEKIVQNQTNDTMYIQRNEIVKIVYDRYAKFGDTIASAILSKTFLPNGQQLMLAKLDLQSVGSAMPDHDQIVDWIDEHGVDAFCERLKIRKPEEKTKESTQQVRYREAKSDQKSTITETGINPVSLKKP